MRRNLSQGITENEVQGSTNEAAVSFFYDNPIITSFNNSVFRSSFILPGIIIFEFKTHKELRDTGTLVVKRIYFTTF